MEIKKVITFPEREEFSNSGLGCHLIFDTGYDSKAQMANNVKFTPVDGGSVALVQVHFDDFGKIEIIAKREHHDYRIYGKTFELTYNVVPKVASLQVPPEYDTPIKRQSISMSVALLLRLRNEGRLILNPSYQRDFVWTLEQKQFYISNLFKDMAELSPTICQFDEDDNTNDFYEVIDGKQRISAVLGFIDGEFPVEGLYYSDLCEDDRKFISNFRFDYTRILSEGRGLSKPSLKTLIQLFLEINLYGTRMSDEDLDKARSLLK